MYSLLTNLKQEGREVARTYSKYVPFVAPISEWRVALVILLDAVST